MIKVAVVAVFAYATGGAAAGLAAQGLSGQAFAVAVAGGFTAGAVQTGSLKGAAIGAVSAGVFFGIGSAFSYRNAPGLYENSTTMTFSGYAAKTLSHGIAGGVMAEMQGGRFGHGFASAGFSEALSPAVGSIGSAPAQAVAAVVIGGTASRLAGGKFANGAVTAAFGFAFNNLPHWAMYRTGQITSSIEQVKNIAEPIGSALVDEVLGFIPGYDLASCAVSGGCGAVGWSLAVIGAIPGGKIGKLGVEGAEVAEGLVKWTLGSFKSEAKWAGQLEKRGWTMESISEAITKGERFSAENLINKGNAATRFVHPQTGQSVVVDTILNEVIHVGGPGFKY